MSGQSSLFGGLQEGPVIEPFLLTAQHRVDKNPNKVNVGQGTYRYKALPNDKAKANFSNKYERPNFCPFQD